MRPGLWLRSVLSVVLCYGLMLAMGVVGAPVVLWRERWTRAWMKLYIRLAFGILRGISGLRVEVRGEVPTDDVIIAAKHQSLLDVLALFQAVPEPRFVMKRSLLWMPVFGLFARRAGALPIDRQGGQGTARRLRDAFAGAHGQVVIYPQGTRVPPGVVAAYRRGASYLYAALDRPLVLAATNGGHFWPRRGVLRRPGVATVEILERHPPGLGQAEAQARIEARIEAASARLSREAEAQQAG